MKTSLASVCARHFSSTSVIALLIIPLTACSTPAPENNPETDAGTSTADAGPDNTDAGPLSNPDAGPLSSPDAGPTTSPDGGADSDVPFTLGVSTLAGWSETGNVDGTRALARFSNPVNVAYRDGTLYVADFDNHKIRTIDTDTHITSSLALPGNFQRPFGLTLTGDGTIYVSTDRNPNGEGSGMTGTIWKIDPITTLASVIVADIGRPRGIVALPDGRIAATDYQHHVVELIDPTNGQTTIIAGVWDSPGMVDGTGADARFSQPYGIGLRSDGVLIVADRSNHRIRMVSLDGTTSTLAGTGAIGFADGSSSIAQFNFPIGISIADNDDIYISDANNYRLRRITGDQVNSVAGNGNAGHIDHDDPLSAELYGLEGISVTPDGSMIYVADGNRGENDPYNRVRQVILP